MHHLCCFLFCSQSSPACVSTNHGTNIKECKEKRNREKLLAGLGSEFSLTHPEDLELDYYDYNVTNASAAPGSYLGMDPAYLVWIPPMDGGVKYDRSGSNGSNTDEYVDPYFEENTSDFQSPLSRSTIKISIETAAILPSFNKTQDKGNELQKYDQNEELPRVLSANTPKVRCGHKSPIDSFQMKEFQSMAPTINVHTSYGNDGQNKDKDCATEKKTAIMKSSCFNNINAYYELDDIQFADEGDNCDNVGTCTGCYEMS